MEAGSTYRFPERAGDVHEFIREVFRMLAHGMKNPVTAMTVSVGLIEEVPQKTDKSLPVLKSSLERFNQILTAVSRLQDVSPGKKQRMAFSSVVLGAAKAHSVQVETVGSPDELQVDVKLWAIILDEFLKNVSVHSGQPARVTWQIKNRETLRVEVADRGPGLGIMSAKGALEPTRRSEKSSGAGMGLTRAAYAAVLLGGQIGIESPAEGGVTVWAEGLLSVH